MINYGSGIFIARQNRTPGSKWHLVNTRTLHMIQCSQCGVVIKTRNNDLLTISLHSRGNNRDSAYAPPLIGLPTLGFVIVN